MDRGQASRRPRVAGSRCGVGTCLLRFGHMRTRRFVLVALLAVLLSAAAGGFFGSTAQATQDQVTQQYKVFTSALAAIER